MSFTGETCPHVKRNTKILLQFRSNKTILSENMIRHPYISLLSGNRHTVQIPTTKQYLQMVVVLVQGI